MLIKIGDHSGLATGRKVYRYLLPDRSAYDIGTVTEINDGTVIIDFGDTVRRFPKAHVSLMMDAYTADEYFMTTVEGELVQDFRHNGLPDTEDESLKDFSDLLGKLNETSYGAAASRSVR